jgi:hypothetical protein
MDFMRHITIISFLLLIAISCSPVKQYKSDPEVLKWEKDIQAFEKLDATEPDPADAILFTGSSSIRLWSTIKEDLAPYTIIHRGYGGAKLTDFAFYADRIIYPHKFKALALFVANDIPGGKNDRTPEEVLGLYQNIVKQVRKKYKEEPIFFIQITPTNSRWKVWDKITEANNLIKNYSSQEKGLYFIETADRFFGDDGKPRAELFRDDQLHLNADGYEIWTAVIKENLDKVLK